MRAIMKAGGMNSTLIQCLKEVTENERFAYWKLPNLNREKEFEFFSAAQRERLSSMTLVAEPTSEPPPEPSQSFSVKENASLNQTPVLKSGYVPANNKN